LISKAKSIARFSHESLGGDFLGHREFIQRAFRGWQILWVKELGAFLDDLPIYGFVEPRLYTFACGECILLLDYLIPNEMSQLGEKVQ
jgi:hypothetical protein